MVGGCLVLAPDIPEFTKTGVNLLAESFLLARKKRKEKLRRQ